jgi:GNAT superfamily N-acetyltransferase
MTSTTSDLDAIGTATLLAAWEEYAAGTATGAVHRHDGVAVGVFPDDPERAVYNNAVLEPGRSARATAAAVDVLEEEYRAAGVTAFAAWTRATDTVARAELERRGYTVSETTRAMGMVLDDLRVPWPDVRLADPDWANYLRLFLPPGLLAGVRPGVFDVALAEQDGRVASAGISYDAAGDCGIFNVETRADARRRGLGTAVTAVLALRARERGCRTATLQATPMAERIYTALGFRDLGVVVEYAPPAPEGPDRATRT